MKEKQREIFNSIPPLPPANDTQYEVWVAKNNKVMVWLVNSIIVEINKSYLLATTAKEIWESTKNTYSVRENLVAIFQVKHFFRSLIQSDKSVTQYYITIMKLWQ